METSSILDTVLTAKKGRVGIAFRDAWLRADPSHEFHLRALADRFARDRREIIHLSGREKLVLKIDATEVFRRSKALEAFLASFEHRATSHIFHFSGATVEIFSDPDDVDRCEYPTDGYVRIERIASEICGQGCASKALRRVCEKADTHGISLDLYVVPENGMSQEMLIAWLGRHGFIGTGEGERMTRLPRPLQS
ncbi:MAG: hypothetical protein ACYDA1_10370 [Vulcanimicrobiaceae bacterium]